MDLAAKGKVNRILTVKVQIQVKVLDLVEKRRKYQYLRRKKRRKKKDGI